MLHLHFDGWFQCRLATNPDPSDEPRGVSGYTFAVAGEPDLDRIIRFHEPVAPRSHGPAVGVYVRRVFRNGQADPNHVLVGAPVSLRGKPRFESRNLLISDDRSGIGIIDPFQLRVAAADVVLERDDVLYPVDGDVPTHLVPGEYIARRAPTRTDGMTLDPVRIADATGITDPMLFRRTRREALEADLAMETDETIRAALQKRIRELQINDESTLRVLSLSLVQSWRFELNGVAKIRGMPYELGGEVNAETAWPIDFWMGCWDADSLTGFVRGTLAVPFTVPAIEADEE